MQGHGGQPDHGHWKRLRQPGFEGHGVRHLHLGTPFAFFPIGYQWWAWVLAFFADDFSYYWFHRTSHECRFFWASHVVHHSSQRYNLGTALRQTWTGGFVSFVFWLWMPLVGFQPDHDLHHAGDQPALSVLDSHRTGQAHGRLGVGDEHPSHHRVHHATNPQYIDRNHAGILIIWDRWFGTFRAGAGALRLRIDHQH